MTGPGGVWWFARHELRLTWRDFLGMMTAGRHWRVGTVAVAVVVTAIFLHGLAWLMVGGYAEAGRLGDKRDFVVITGILALSWSLMMSQAMESLTRAFYARADLDLILSSPADARRLFAVRLGALALSIIALGLALAASFVDVLAIRGGLRWLAADGVVIASASTAVAVAIVITVALFRAFGAKRTRLIAQIMAAVIGAAFVIGLQFAAILSYGTLSRFAFLDSAWLVRVAPDVGSFAWLPARAAAGDGRALTLVLGASALLLAAAIAIFAPHFARNAIAAAGLSHGVARRQGARRRFRRVTPAAALRNKEWTLLRRDPWLVSQTLMQLLYLLPPALLLWRSFAQGGGSLTLLVPVLIMAAGQLSGGLAWLAISGEDAPDLVSAAPVRPSQILRAKAEAVMGSIALIFGPFVVALALRSLVAALVATLGIVVATASSITIQFWFRAQAKRSHFRRRQTSSRIATFAEAFSSIGWAATGALAAAGTWLAAMTVVMTLVVLIGARQISPRTLTRGAAA